MELPTFRTFKVALGIVTSNAPSDENAPDDSTSAVPQYTDKNSTPSNKERKSSSSRRRHTNHKMTTELNMEKGQTASVTEIEEGQNVDRAKEEVVGIICSIFDLPSTTTFHTGNTSVFFCIVK